MGCQGQFALTPRTLYSSTSTWFFEPATEWMGAYGLASVLGVLSSKGTTVNQGLEVGLGWQVAAVRPNNPSAGGPSGPHGGTITTGSGVQWHNTGVLTPSLGGNAWVRFGFYYRSPVSTPAEAAVQGTLASIQCGRVVGATQFHAVSMSSARAYEPVSPWLPASQVTYARFSQIPTGLTGQITFRQAFQTAGTDPETPDVWQPEGSESAFEQTYSEFTPYLANKMWVRFGLAFGLMSGSALGQADVQATVAIRK